MLVTLLGMVTLVRLEQSFKRIIPDAGDTVGDGHARQAEAVVKLTLPDIGDAVGNDHARQWSF